MKILFRNLVRRSGKPEPKSLWSDPKKDPSFIKAVRENRVLTVVQEPKTKSDFGRIGFHQQPHATFFIFPKPLPRDEKSKVIGIKYELVEQPVIRTSSNREKSFAGKSRLTKPSPPKRARQANFHVVVRRTAIIETSLSIRARSKADAKKRALESVRQEPFDSSRAVIKNQVEAVE
jgi:hypothetical protein